ncbi:probable bifunctional dTTP/UTP pyrophosphatase/methyltransferase protein [Argonauta hians]
MNIEVVPSTFEENLDPHNYLTPMDYARATAREKALVVARRLGVSEKQSGDSVKSAPQMVIGADTIITLGDKIYGKPKNRQEAEDTLNALSGKPHMAVTGVSIVTPASWRVGRLLKEDDHPEVCVYDLHETTKVFMMRLTPEILKAYLDSGEYEGRAGSYSIQGVAGSLVEAIDGDFYNVVGLPLHKFCRGVLEILMTKLE